MKLLQTKFQLFISQKVYFFRDSDSKELPPDDKRKRYAKALGFPGYICGGICGLLWVFVCETCKSAMMVFGGFLNWGADRFWTPGFDMYNKRSFAQKCIGILGYLVMGPIACTLGLAILASRKLPSLLLFLLINLTVLIPLITMIVKFCKLSERHERLVMPNQKDKDPLIQGIMAKFRNLYSSLNMLGQFKAGEAVREGQSGGKGIFHFIWRIFSLNINSPTEWVLDKLLDGFKEYGQPRAEGRGEGVKAAGYFASQQYRKALTAAKEKYKKEDDCCGGWWTTQKEIDNAQAEIDTVDKFIRSYIKGEVIEGVSAAEGIPDDLYSKLEKSHSDLFRGKKPSAPQPPVSEEKEGKVEEPDARR